MGAVTRGEAALVFAAGLGMAVIGVLQIRRLRAHKLPRWVVPPGRWGRGYILALFGMGVAGGIVACVAGAVLMVRG